jgi:triosephosphate isomerase (TIM)
VTRTPLMAGNWKMNLNHFEAIALVQKIAFSLNDADYEACDVAVIPPFTDLRSVQTLIEGDRLSLTFGAQDVSAHPAGAYTGEVSAAMLERLGCSYVLAGHSERRDYHQESNELVRAKAAMVASHGMTPIVCVGEPLDVRQAGDAVPYVLEQLTGSLADFSAEQLSGFAIAYEPVWAIGTGEVATPGDAQQVCGAIRAWLQSGYGAGVADAVRLLYGGSVKANNIAEIMEQDDVDGALIGGASLDVDEFVSIVRYRLHGASVR